MLESYRAGCRASRGFLQSDRWGKLHVDRDTQTAGHVAADGAPMLVAALLVVAHSSSLFSQLPDPSEESPPLVPPGKQVAVAPAKGPPVEGPGSLLRFMNTTARIDRAAGGPAKAYGVFEAPDGGRAILIEIDNTDPARYSPPKALIESLTKLTPGTIVRPRVRAQGEQRWLLSVERHKLKAGEDEPHGYVFDGTDRRRVGRWDYLAVKLKRFDEETVALVPNRTAADGNQKPDARLVREVAGLTRGDVVRADVRQTGQHALLADVMPYRPVITGDVVRVGSSPAEPGADAPLELGILTTNGPQVLSIPSTDPDGRPLRDPAGTAGAEGLRAGLRVRVYPRQDADGRTVVWRVELAGEVRRLDHNHVEARYGGAALVVFRRQAVWFAHVHTYADDEANADRAAERIGLARVFNEPGVAAWLNIDGPRLERLREAVAQPKLYTASESARFLPFRHAHDNGTPAERAAAAQEVFRILASVGERECAHEAARAYAMKLIVTPEQYRAITDAGREEPAWAPAPAPAQPGKAAAPGAPPSP